MVELRLPNITGVTEKEQLQQIKSYLYQLSEQLQYAFDTVNTSAGETRNSSYIANQPYPGYSTGPSSTNEQITFASLKSLIIKSADIVDAYYDVINKKLEGTYVAQSTFGEFAEKTSQAIEETSTSITQEFENIQVIITDQGGAIESVSGEVAGVKGELKTIGEDLSYAQQSIITLGGGLEDIDSYVASVEGEVNALDSSLQAAKSELQSAVDTTKTELTGSINNTKDELSGSINDVKNNLEGSIDNAEANAIALADAAEAAAKGYTDDTASALAGQIGETASDLAGQIVDTNGRIDEANGTIEDLGTGLEDAKQRIKSAEGALETAKSDLNSSIQKVAESVSNTDKLLESARAKLQGSLDDLEFALSGLMQIVIGVTAYIKSGLLYYTDAGIPVYGIEIGQEVDVNGEKAFHKFSRFSSEKLSFYDPNGIEVAYISDKKLYIGQAEITISLRRGGIIDLVLSNGDVVKKWVGKE
jgi:archaellum component FlaC